MRCSSSSSSGVESPSAKKGRKIEMPASQSYQNTKINSYLHEDHNPGEIRTESHARIRAED